MKGYNGKILRVDLSSGRTWSETLDPHIARKHLGGRGFAAKALFEEVPPGTDALSPENRLLFSSGLLSAVDLPANTRFVVAGKSPLSGLYGEANGAGSFSRELRRAGYDLIIIQGKAEKPVYLWVHDGKAEVRDAAALWGKMTGETEDLLKAELGQAKPQVACIGPAGEKMVRLAAVIHARHRAAARLGLGAVMGSKNLKAVAVSGSHSVGIADAALMDRVRGEVQGVLQNVPAIKVFREFGTTPTVAALNDAGILPTRNFARGVFAGYQKISAEAMNRTMLKRPGACRGCGVACHRLVQVTSGPYAPVTPDYGGPEYETLAAFGSLLENDNLESVAQASQICNMYGLDTISAGAVIAWAMECYQRGILSRDDLDGIDLHWGNAGGMLQLLGKMARREGVGDLLAEGSRRAAEKVGRGAERFAMHVKGLELAMHDPRGKKGVGLGYAVSPRGGSHMDLAHDPSFENEANAKTLGLPHALDRFATEGKPQLERMAADIMTVLDGIGACGFLYYCFYGRVPLVVTVRAISAITGWDFSEAEFVKVGERNNNLARAFNVREGVTRADDTLPLRLMEEALPEGRSAGHTVSAEDLSSMLDEYYRLRGWSPDGKPTAATLQALGLEPVAAELVRLGMITPALTD